MSNVHPIPNTRPVYDKLFHKVDGLQAILSRGGVYKQVDLYRRLIDGEHRLFAKHGGGFISLSGRRSAASVARATTARPGWRSRPTMALY